ncbi:hypothetical protein RN001_003895 [Aquatica leii]|uniref:Uncharacterized protein n=1 Tax=Aquatica leii TaxID=1421715 RepID=A0AAN7SMJ3_9COLE|nr:hypothetical protein RN001_003895 [Aquatica leii]
MCYQSIFYRRQIKCIVQLELESHLRQRITLSLSTSPPKFSVEVPKSPKPHVEPINSVWSVDAETKDLKTVSRIEVEEKIVDKEELPYKNVSTPSTPKVVITSMTPPLSIKMLKKLRLPKRAKPLSLVSVTAEPKPKLRLRTKSNSLDFVDSLKQDEMSQINADKQKVLSTTNLSDNTVMRRKSLVKQKQDEEPEPMKIFARRSLKVKDSDEIDNAVQENKENCVSAPVVEYRKKPVEKPKEPLVKTKFVETTKVTFRKPNNNKIFTYQQRTISVNIPKTKNNHYR